MAFIPAAIAAVEAISATAAAATATTAAAAGTTAAVAASAIPTWLTIGSTVLSTVGALSSAKASSDSAKYNAAVNDIQAKQAGDQAAYAAGEQAKKTRLQLAAQRAGAAQSGIDLSGSVLDIMGATAQQGGLNYMTSIYNGDVNATSLQNDATLNRSRASDATMAGYVNAGSSILSGISDVYKRRGNALSVGGA